MFCHVFREIPLVRALDFNQQTDILITSEPHTGLSASTGHRADTDVVVRACRTSDGAVAKGLYNSC